jgi:hypothetical protein
MDRWTRWLPGRELLRHYEAAWLPRDTSFHPTLGSAVDAYLEEHAVDWRP